MCKRFLRGVDLSPLSTILKGSRVELFESVVVRFFVNGSGSILKNHHDLLKGVPISRKR